MNRGLFRLWLTASFAWIVFIAIRTWQTWPEDILWDNGITSRQEAAIHATFMISVPLILLGGSLMLIWAAKGFRT